MPEWNVWMPNVVKEMFELVGGANKTEGRVEVCLFGSWGGTYVVISGRTMMLEWSVNNLDIHIQVCQTIFIN